MALSGVEVLSAAGPALARAHGHGRGAPRSAWRRPLNRSCADDASVADVTGACTWLAALQKKRKAQVDSGKQ